MFRRLIVSGGVLAASGALMAGMAMPAGAATVVRSAPMKQSASATAKQSVAPHAAIATAISRGTCINGSLGFAGIAATARATEFGRSGVIRLGIQFQVQHQLVSGRWQTYKSFALARSNFFPNDSRNFFFQQSRKYVFTRADINKFIRLAAVGVFLRQDGAIFTQTVYSGYCHPVRV